MRGSLLCAFFVSGLLAQPTLAQTSTEFLTNWVQWPVFVTSRPNDSSHLFVGENLTGTIVVLDPVTHLPQGTPLLDIDDLPEVFDAEQGLLGMVFDPNYNSNGYFYVSYTASNDDVVVQRYTMAGNPLTSTVADPTTARTILRIPKPSGEHNGGWIGFGKDDYLYVTTGDGGHDYDTGPGHNDDIGNAQDLTDNLLGKVLRLDVHGDDFIDDPNRNYAIPASNPFVGREGDDEIWAYGLRNPWRASFDLLTSDLWIGDVGQNDLEEVDFLPADSAGGQNFGWRLREGTIQTPWPGIGGPNPPGAVEPVYEYSHYAPGEPFPGNAAVIGGVVYRGPVAALEGHYLFADFYGDIFDLDPDAVDPKASVIEIKDRLLPNHGSLNLISSFGQDADGNVYITNLFGPFSGEVFKIVTQSQTAVWNGDSTAAGVAGNGTTWSAANNWTRGSSVDTAFAAEDNVIFTAGSSIQQIDLDADQTVAAVTFASPYTLENHKLIVISGNITVQSGVTATIASDVGADTEFRSLRKLGDGTLLINGHAGQTAVKAGTVGGSGTFDHLTIKKGGIVQPGGVTSGDRVGRISVEQSFTVESGGQLVLDIGGNDNSDDDNLQFDELLVAGVARLGGSLTVNLVDLGQGAFDPEQGDEFLLIYADEIQGAFDSFTLPPLWTGLVWKPIATDSTFSLAVELRTPGDYNGDGHVDSADYVSWRKQVGLTGDKLAADGSGPSGTPDGIIDTYDYQFWRSNFGATPLGDGYVATVPEPTSVGLVMLLVAQLALVRSRR